MRFLPVVIVLLLTVAPQVVAAQTFRLTESDGTIHFTNAPTDPRYRRMGIAPVGRAPSAAAVAPAPSLAPGTTPSPARGILGDRIQQAAARYGLSELLVSALIRVESGFNPRAVSPKGARGLMQLMPTTAATLGVRDSFDPIQNIDGGVRHLRGLMDRFSNNVPLALAAYNAGEAAVLQYGGIPPYPETQDYVTRILRLIGDQPSGGASAIAQAAAASETWPTYRQVAPDGTMVYTNIPPRPRR